MEESKIDKSRGDWSIDALREYFERILKESDRRYEQRFEDQKEAIVKAEEATERRFEGVNEFRQTLSDQAATFVSRTEVLQQYRAINDKVDLVTSRMDRLDGRSGGYTATWGYLIGAVVMVGGLITIIAAIVGAAIFIASKGGS